MRWLMMPVLLVWAVAAWSAPPTLTLVSENDWYPYAAERQGEARGLSVDIIRAAYAAVGVQVHFKVMSYARCMELLDLGEEIGCFNTPDDKAIRQRQRLPRHALDSNPAYVYVRADFPRDAMTLEELDGKGVGLVNGYRYGDAFMQDPMILHEYSASDLLNLKKLAAGRLDYIVLYERVARYLMGQYGKDLGIQIKPVTPIGDIDIYLSFSAVHPRAAEAMQLFDQGMDVLQRTGRYAQILDEWDRKLVEGVAAN